jgi:hypothetical protein
MDKAITKEDLAWRGFLLFAGKKKSSLLNPGCSFIF